jgi:hypothetical protein
MSRSERFARVLRGLLLAALLLPGLALPARAGGIAVIVHPDNAQPPLSRDQVAYLFLRKAKAFPGGGMAKPVLMPEHAVERVRFEREILRKEPLQIRAYWSRLVFTGRGKPPRSMPTVTDVKRYVASEPAAISYIPANEVDASVRVVYRLH